MNRCPNCGWEIQFGVTCYNCVGREQDARRHGGKSINSKWRQKNKHTPRPVIVAHSTDEEQELASPRPVTPKINRRMQRLGINRLLHDLYGTNHLLSDILSGQGFSAKQINNLRKRVLNNFLDDIVDDWIALFKKQLSWQAEKTVCFYYKLEGKEQESLGWSSLQEKQYLVEGIRVMRYASMRQKLEKIVQNTAQKYLNE